MGYFFKKKVIKLLHLSHHYIHCFVTPCFSTTGTFSRRSLASFNPRLVNALTSLITLILAAASNFSNFTSKAVFSTFFSSTFGPAAPPSGPMSKLSVEIRYNFGRFNLSDKVGIICPLFSSDSSFCKLNDLFLGWRSGTIRIIELRNFVLSWLSQRIFRNNVSL